MMNHINDVTVVGAVIFLVWVVNQAGIPRRFSPLIATIIAIIFTFFYLEPGNFLDSLIHGILIAASAIGFHSGTKNTYQQFNGFLTKKK